VIRKILVWILRAPIIIVLVLILWWIYLFVTSRVAHARAVKFLREGQVTSAYDFHNQDVYTLKSGEKIIVRAPIFAEFRVSEDLHKCGEPCKNVVFVIE
jgi:hypothetical protein